MSHGEDLFAPREEANSRPSFETALRGYDKRQVDHYVERTDNEISTLTDQRERAYGHIRDLTAQLQDLTGQLHQMQGELTELRERPPQVDRATFRDLVPTVDQIMALAEKQGQEITDAAAQRAAELQAQAEKALVDAREQAVQSLQDLESELATRRAEEDQVDEERKAAAEAELAEVRELAERLRSDAEATREHAHQEAEATRSQTQQELAQLRANVEQEIDERRQVLQQVQAELESSHQRLAQSRHDQVTADHDVAQLQQRLDEVRRDLTEELGRLEEARRAAESADRHAKAVRAKVQREARRVADMAAAAVLEAAARGGETGEYPLVMPGRTGAAELADQIADQITNEAGGGQSLENVPDPAPATMGETAHRPADMSHAGAVHMTRDGAVEVTHDAALDGANGRYEGRGGDGYDTVHAEVAEPHHAAVDETAYGASENEQSVPDATDEPAYAGGVADEGARRSDPGRDVVGPDRDTGEEATVEAAAPTTVESLDETSPPPDGRIPSQYAPNTWIPR
jgi:peptidoglycan DL-endopeptidase RipA